MIVKKEYRLEGLVIILALVIIGLIVINSYNNDKSTPIVISPIDTTYRDYIRNLEIKDSAINFTIKNITNNYKHHYETNNIINDSFRYEFIDSLLARHKQIKLERNYNIFN